MRKALFLILVMILIGTVGHYFLEGWPFLDGFYMTIITIFTVGFREVPPLTPGGQLFTIVIILGGVGTLIYAFTQIGDMVFGQDITFNPSPETEIQVGDTLLVLGGKDSERNFEKLFVRGTET
ncbi:MAG: ion channel [Candidatus Aminicenantaceae bacterium]